MSDEKSMHIDETQASHFMDLHSRDMAAWGIETMKNLSALKVLIIGLRGVGIETAKNLTLAGPKTITLVDNNITQIADLGANFFLKEEHVGKVPRAQACAKSVNELNPYVDVNVYSQELSNEFIQQYGAVIVTETLPKAELLRINTACRERTLENKVDNKIEKIHAPSAFILAVTHGVSAHIFTDFGKGHVVTDSDGEPTRTMVIDDFEEGNIVKVAQKAHGFDDGDEIRIEEIESKPAQSGETSLTGLNALSGIKIKRRYATFEQRTEDGKVEKRTRQIFDQLQLDLSETELKDKKLSAWKTGGIITEIKRRHVLEFRSISDTLSIPATDGLAALFGPQHPDQGAWEKGAGKTLHLLYHATLNFQEETGYFPRLHNDDDSKKLLELFRKLNDFNKTKDGFLTVDSIDEKRIKAYSWYFPTELTGYCAFLGGVAAQEVVKKFGKYLPIFQWLHSDHVQLIGNQIPSDAIPQSCRYDHQISLFGKSFQSELCNQKIFLVGCGALGCEYLKGLSLMGVGSGPKGKVWCTDMDRIEVSNLSRQFLFRSIHVSQPKSKIAATQAKAMNNAFNVESLEMKVWAETEDYFNDEFWENLDLCWNALDNVQARKYTDSKCLFYSKPLLESGTQGTKCNSEVIIPYKTKSYNDGEEVEAEGIPMCTLQNFPYQIEHCIEWARSEFTGLFESIPKTYNTFVTDPKKFFEQVETAQGEEKIKMVETVKHISEIQKTGITFEKCIHMAFDEFVSQHITRIRNLMHTFPQDDVVKDKITGNVIGLFWTGHKRFPQVPEFNLENPLVIDYLLAASNLFAFSFGIPQVRDRKQFLTHCINAKLLLPEWKPQKVEVNEDNTEDNKKNDVNEDQEKLVAEIVKHLKNIDRNKLKKMIETEFEKDDDTNFHIDFITVCSNSRAWNYRIKEISRHKCKIIAGRIIPALATTTAMITGLVELEFYKLRLGLGFLNEDAFYNANINLAVAQFQYFQPDSAIRHVKHEQKDGTTVETVFAYPNFWTSWDKLVVDCGNLTVQEFVDRFPQLFWSIEVELLHKAGKLEHGRLLFDGKEIERGTKMEKQQLARSNISDAKKQELQDLINQIEQRNANLRKGRDSKLIDRYIELYGPLVPKTRNYVILQGGFRDVNGNAADIPIIKYVFKH